MFNIYLINHTIPKKNVLSIILKPFINKSLVFQHYQKEYLYKIHLTNFLNNRYQKYLIYLFKHKYFLLFLKLFSLFDNSIDAYRTWIKNSRKISRHLYKNSDFAYWLNTNKNTFFNLFLFVKPLSSKFDANLHLKRNWFIIMFDDLLNSIIKPVINSSYIKIKPTKVQYTVEKKFKRFSLFNGKLFSLINYFQYINNFLNNQLLYQNYTTWMYNKRYYRELNTLTCNTDRPFILFSFWGYRVYWNFLFWINLQQKIQNFNNAASAYDLEIADEETWIIFYFYESIEERTEDEQALDKYAAVKKLKKKKDPKLFRGEVFNKRLFKKLPFMVWRGRQRVYFFLLIAKALRYKVPVSETKLRKRWLRGDLLKKKKPRRRKIYIPLLYFKTKKKKRPRYRWKRPKPDRYKIFEEDSDFDMPFYQTSSIGYYTLWHRPRVQLCIGLSWLNVLNKYKLDLYFKIRKFFEGAIYYISQSKYTKSEIFDKNWIFLLNRLHNQIFDLFQGFVLPQSNSSKSFLLNFNIFIYFYILLIHDMQSTKFKYKLVLYRIQDFNQLCRECIPWEHFNRFRTLDWINTDYKIKPELQPIGWAQKHWIDIRPYLVPTTLQAKSLDGKWKRFAKNAELIDTHKFTRDQQKLFDRLNFWKFWDIPEHRRTIYERLTFIIKPKIHDLYYKHNIYTLRYLTYYAETDNSMPWMVYSLVYKYSSYWYTIIRLKNYAYFFKFIQIYMHSLHLIKLDLGLMQRLYVKKKNIFKNYNFYRWQRFNRLKYLLSSKSVTNYLAPNMSTLKHILILLLSDPFKYNKKLIFHFKIVTRLKNKKYIYGGKKYVMVQNKNTKIKLYKYASRSFEKYSIYKLFDQKAKLKLYFSYFLLLKTTDSEIFWRNLLFTEITAIYKSIFNPLLKKGKKTILIFKPKLKRKKIKIYCSDNIQKSVHYCEFFDLTIDEEQIVFKQILTYMMSTISAHPLLSYQSRLTNVIKSNNYMTLHSANYDSDVDDYDYNIKIPTCPFNIKGLRDSKMYKKLKDAYLKKLDYTVLDKRYLQVPRKITTNDQNDFDLFKSVSLKDSIKLQIRQKELFYCLNLISIKFKCLWFVKIILKQIMKIIYICYMSIYNKLSNLKFYISKYKPSLIFKKFYFFIKLTKRIYSLLSANFDDLCSEDWYTAAYWTEIGDIISVDYFVYLSTYIPRAENPLTVHLRKWIEEGIKMAETEEGIIARYIFRTDRAGNLKNEPRLVNFLWEKAWKNREDHVIKTAEQTTLTNPWFTQIQNGQVIKYRVIEDGLKVVGIKRLVNSQYTVDGIAESMLEFERDYIPNPKLKELGEDNDENFHISQADKKKMTDTELAYALVAKFKRMTKNIDGEKKALKELGELQEMLREEKSMLKIKKWKPRFPNKLIQRNWLAY